MSSVSQSKIETAWAWASLLVLIVCWDAALRLDQRVPLPRVRLAHAVEVERTEQGIESGQL
jgi:hypothetical protein